MDYKDQTFTGEVVNIDNNKFEECSFVRCKVIYAGGESEAAKTLIAGQCDAYVMHGDEAPGYADALGWPVFRAVTVDDYATMMEREPAVQRSPLLEKIMKRAASSARARSASSKRRRARHHTR